MSRHEDAPDLYRALLQSMCSNSLAHTPEGIAIWLQVQCASSETKLPKHVWNHRQPFSYKELPSVIKIMRHGEDPDRETDPSNKAVDLSGVKQTTPSFYWTSILGNLVKLVQANEKQVSTESGYRSTIYASFWSDAIDSTFFAEKASIDRKALGFQILRSQLASAPSWTLEITLSSQLLKCLINHCADVKRALHKASKGVLSAILHRAGTDSASAVTIVRHLLFREAEAADFDKRTSKSGTKLLQAIMGQAKDDTLNELASSFDLNFKALHNLNTSESVQAQQRILADLVLQTIRNQLPSLKSSLKNGQPCPQWPGKMLTCLAVASCLKQDDASKTPTKSLNLIKSRLDSSVGVILSGGIEIAQPVLMDIIGSLDQIPVSDLDIIDEDEVATHRQLRRAMYSARTIDAEASPEGMEKALLMLTCVTILQAFTGDPDALSLLDELSDYHDSLKDPQDSREDTNDSMMELLLSIAARPSQSNRKLIEQVFGALAAGLSENSMQSMLDILDQRENTAGQKALFEREADLIPREPGDGQAELSQSDDENDSEVQEISNAAGDGGGSDSGSSSSSDEASLSGADSADQRLDDALAQMLQTNPGDGQIKESQDDSDASMGDEEMFALEPHLAAAFRARTNAVLKSEDEPGKAPPSATAQRKKDHTAAKTNMINFKNRVLDLLAIWLKQDPSNELTLQVVVPLLRLVRTTSSKQIAEKTVGVLRAYFDGAKGKTLAFSGATGDKAQTLDGLLHEIHDEALLFGSKLHAGACSRASLFMARCLVSNATPGSATPTNGDLSSRRSDSKKKKKPIKDTPSDKHEQGSDNKLNSSAWDLLIDLYASTQRRRRKQKSGLPASFWREFVDWETSTAT